MAILTRKFSEFPQGTLDEAVGLASNTNTRGPGGGGGGGTGVTQEIIQANNFSKGEWIRYDEGSNLYVRALATTTENAEVIGVVILADPTKFTLQQSGYITVAKAVFPVLTRGQPQFLSDVTPGAMMNTDVLIDNEVSRPVFIPDSTNGVNTGGWVLPYRGIIAGGGPDTGGTTPTPPANDSNIVTVTQNGHGFNVGDWLRVDTPTVGPNQVHYVKAIATSLANSQSVGVVIQVVDVNTFRLQFSGYVATNLLATPPTTAPFQDAALALLVPSTVYYLSPTVAGAITSVDPGLTGGFSKPLYISEQTTATVVTNAGYVLPQRPLVDGNDNPNIHTVIQANTFNVGQWVYIDHDLAVANAYQLAQGNTLARAQVAGVIIAASPTQFTVQQDGWIDGAVNGTYIDGGGAPTSGVVYYLSLTTAGNLTATVPTAGQVSKPCYVQERVATFTGQILPQRPLIVAGAGGAGAIQLITTMQLNNVTNFTLSNILDGTYTDIYISFRNLVIQSISPPQGYVADFWLRYEIGGVVRSDNNYWAPNDGTLAAAIYPGPKSPGTAVSALAGLQSGFTHRSVTTANGLLTYNLDLYFPYANGTTNYKSNLNSDLGFVTVGPDQIAGLDGYNVNLTKTGGTYAGSTGMLTGFNFFFANKAAPPNNFIILQGFVSVYGRIS